MAGLMVLRIPTDAEMVGSSGWSTSLAVMMVGLMVVRIPTDSGKAASLVTSLAVTMALMKV